MRVLGLVVLGAGLLGMTAACGDSTPVATPSPSAVTAAPETAAPETTAPETTAPVTTTPATRPAATSTPATRDPAPAAQSNLSQLEALGIDIKVGMILDVADDGVDRWLQVGKNGVVDFTGTTRTDSTMMSFKAAPVSARNRVTIKPPFWNEDTGAGSCVADTPGAALKLETCRPGRASQIWQVVPAGDSGQFELRGAYGILHVDDGRLATGGGRTGLQTLDFAG